MNGLFFVLNAKTTHHNAQNGRDQNQGQQATQNDLRPNTGHDWKRNLHWSSASEGRFGGI